MGLPVIREKFWVHLRFMPRLHRYGGFVLLMEFQTLDMEELEDKILTKVCNECFEEIHANYNPDWIPKPIKGDKNE